MPGLPIALFALLASAAADKACLQGECGADFEEAALLQHTARAHANSTKATDCSALPQCAAQLTGCRPSACVDGDPCCINGKGCEFCGADCPVANCKATPPAPTPPAPTPPAPTPGSCYDLPQCVAQPSGCRPSACVDGDPCCIKGKGCEFCGADCPVANCKLKASALQHTARAHANSTKATHEYE